MNDGVTMSSRPRPSARPAAVGTCAAWAPEPAIHPINRSEPISCGLERGEQSRPEPLAQAFQAAVAERSDTHAVDRSCRLDQLGQRLHGRFRFAVDVESRVGPALEQVAHQWDRFATVDAQRGQLGPRHVDDLTCVPARPREIGVVKRDQHAVRRDVDVGLEVAVAERHRVFERRHRVLRIFAGPTAVSERDRPRPVQVGVFRCGHRPRACHASAR